MFTCDYTSDLRHIRSLQYNSFILMCCMFFIFRISYRFIFPYFSTVRSFLPKRRFRYLRQISNDYCQRNHIFGTYVGIFYSHSGVFASLIQSK